MCGAFHVCAWKDDAERRQAMMARSSFGPLLVRGGQLGVRGAGASATAHALVSDAPCQTTQHAEWPSIVLPKIDLFGLIIVECSEKVTR